MADAPDTPDVNPPAGAEDGERVRRSLAGDRSAFDELVKHHQRQAMAVAYRLLGNSADAMDVTQDAFVRAYKSLESLQKPEAFAGWLMRIVSNLSLNYRRSRKIRQTSTIDSLGDDPARPEPAEERSAGGNPLAAVAGHELGERLQQALAQLPEKQRQAVLMFTIEQMPQKDVAAALKCSVEAVKWHVFQGRKKLKELLSDCL